MQPRGLRQNLKQQCLVHDSVNRPAAALYFWRFCGRLASGSRREGGRPAVIIVGLPDAAVKESRDRIKTAIENSGLKYVMGRTTILSARRCCCQSVDSTPES
jgi:hypothetical protein